MESDRDDRRFGIAWLLFALARRCTLPTRPPTISFAHTMRLSIPFARGCRSFLSRHSFAVWLTGLIAGILLLLVLFVIRLPRLSSAAIDRGGSWAYRWRLQRRVAHFQFDLFPSVDAGVYSSPFLLASAAFLLYAAFRAMKIPLWRTG